MSIEDARAALARLWASPVMAQAVVPAIEALIDTLASMATRAGMSRSEMVKLLSSRAPASEGKTDG